MVDRGRRNFSRELGRDGPPEGYMMAGQIQDRYRLKGNKSTVAIKPLIDAGLKVSGRRHRTAHLYREKDVERIAKKLGLGKNANPSRKPK